MVLRAVAMLARLAQLNIAVKAAFTAAILLRCLFLLLLPPLA
jgi:hypothetical protein